MYISLYVKYLLFLLDFNETWIFLADFGERLNYQNFIKIHPVGAELFHADRRTDRDMKKLTAALRNFAEILGSNPTGGMDICLLWVSCVVR